MPTPEHTPTSEQRALQEALDQLSPDDPRRPLVREALRASDPDRADRSYAPRVTLRELMDQYVTLEVLIPLCLERRAAWYDLAFFLYDATRSYGSRDRLYGLLWYACQRAGVDAPSKRTCHRLIRLGRLLARWDLGKEDVQLLSWRVAYDVLTEADEEDLERGETAERLERAPRILLCR